MCLAVGLTAEEQLDHAIAELEAGGDANSSVSFVEYLRWCVKFERFISHSAKRVSAPFGRLRLDTNSRRPTPVGTERPHKNCNQTQIMEGPRALKCLTSSRLSSRRWRCTGGDVYHRMAPLKQGLSSQSTMGRVLQVLARGCVSHHATRSCNLRTKTGRGIPLGKT